MERHALLFRHGEPVDDGKDICRGRGIDAPLSPTGLWQTQKNIDELRERFHSRDLHRALVVTSPLQRASKIGELLHEQLGIEFVRDEAFVDIDVGDWEGRSWDDIQALWPDDHELCFTDALRMKLPGGESIEAFRDRTIAAWQHWTREAQKKLLIFGLHRCANKVILSHVDGRVLHFKGQPVGCMNHLKETNSRWGVVGGVQILYASAEAATA